MAKSSPYMAESDFINNYVKSINWKSRLDREIPFLTKLYQKNNYKTVLDLGCGPGFHVKRFAEIDFHSIGVDLNEGAINYANAEVLDLTLNMKFKQGDFLQDPSILNGNIDVIYSLGNSLMIIWSNTEKTITNIFSYLYNALETNGGLFFQILNSDAPRKGYVFSNINYNDETNSNQMLVKHFLPIENKLWTHFVTIRWKEGEKTVEKDNSEPRYLTLIPQSELESIMRKVGFKTFAYWENYAGESFKPNISDSLLCFAQK